MIYSRQQLMLCNIAWSRPKLFSDTNFISLLPVLMVVVIFCSRSGTVSVLGPIFEPEDCLLDWSCPLCDCGLKSTIMKSLMAKSDYCGLCMWQRLNVISRLLDIFHFHSPWFGSKSVSKQLPPYPSPNPTLTLDCYQLTVVVVHWSNGFMT